MTVASFLGGVIAALLTLPLAWKWDLGMHRVGIGLIAIVLAAGAVAVLLGALLDASFAMHALLGAALTLTGALSVLAYRFYRDPERSIPSGENVIVSPADGEVVYIKCSQNGQLPVSSKNGHDVALAELTRTDVHHGESIVVAIGMSFLDVHVNRAPIAGQISMRRHFPGRFGSLRRPEMVFENERATTWIAGRRLDVAVVQIASRLVRQIAAYVGEGEEVALGERIGVIRLGSQVDVVLPSRSDLQVLVHAGDRVYAGTSVIATVGAEAE